MSKPIAIFAMLLLFPALLPGSALAQGRLFERGESGIVAAYDLSAYKVWEQWRSDGSSWVMLTYKGLVDFGLGSTVMPYRNNYGSALFGNVVVLDHNERREIGIQLGARYARSTWDTSYSDELYSQIRDLFLETNLRVFRRLVAKPKTRVVLGLAALHRFHQHQLKAPDGEVLYGSDYSEWGAVLDLETMNFGWLFLRGRFEYADHNRSPYEWKFVATGSIGLSISFGGGKEATDAP